MWTRLVLASLLAVSLRPPCMAQSNIRAIVIKRELVVTPGQNGDPKDTTSCSFTPRVPLPPLYNYGSCGIGVAKCCSDPDETHKPNDWYKALCAKDDDCHQEDAVCFMGKCLCRPGFFFSIPDDKCSASCSSKDLQDTFTEYPNSGIRGYYIRVQTGVKLQKCKNLCASTTSCLTFDFKDEDGRCLLHYITSRETTSGWYPETSTYWTHYQRNCKETPDLFPGPELYNSSCHNDEECGDPYSRCLSGTCLCALDSIILNKNKSACPTLETCGDWQKTGAKSGVYFIRLNDSSVDQRVWCDMESDGGGWLVFQRRTDGSVDFYRKWREYEHGFGDPKNEFWLGLAQLHSLTKSRRHRLHIDLVEVAGKRHRAEYSSFRVDGPETNYRLLVSGYSGDAGDIMAIYNNQSFSTYDRDNDKSSHNCAAIYHNAWWYGSCHTSDLKAQYKAGGAKGSHGLKSQTFPNDAKSFTFSEMKVKPV